MAEEKNNFARITNDIFKVGETLNYQDVLTLAQAIEKHKRIFIGGSGRSLFMMKCLAMRLMQIGYTAFVIGETITPSIQEGDLLIFGSGSGETKTLITMAHKAKEIGANIGLISIFPKSTLGQLAEFHIQVHAPTSKDTSSSDSKPLQPGASLFEQSLLIIGDSIILELIADKSIESANQILMQNHANLE